MSSLKRHRGFIGIAALMFVLIVVLFAMSHAAMISSSNVSDSTRQADSVEALFIAESAIEHIGYRFVNSDPLTCDDATVGVPDAAVPIGRGTFKVLGAYTTKFDGTTALGATECRVRVQGTITSSGVTRTIDTVVSREDDIISISSLNPNFNTTPFDGTRADDDETVNKPVNWETLSSVLTSNAASESMSFVPYDQNGGNNADATTCKTDATALNCDRAAFIRKTSPGQGLAALGGGFNNTGTPIVVSIPVGTTSKTLRLTFDFRVWTKGGSQQELYFSPRLVFDTGGVEATGSSGGDCAATSATGWCEAGNTSPGQPAYKGFMGKGCGFVDTPCFESGPADSTLCPSYNPDTSYNGAFGTTGSGGTYAECFTNEGHNPPRGTTGYKTGYLTYVVNCIGTCLSTRTVTLQGISFVRADGSNGFTSKAGSLTWAWIDNLRLSVPSLSGGGPSKLWREVAAP
jgi:hypothetical protein